MVVGAALGLTLVSTTPAMAQSCFDLWYNRNSIFKAAGYCFTTSQAIQTFGNAGCLYDDEREVPLSANQRRQVQAIRAQERAYGCNY